MNKLLFVDDDYIIIRSYLHLVDWKRLGVSEVFSATSGEEAKQLILQHRPNIMVSDIEMPGLSGLELTKWVLQQGLNVKVIYLSAYDDFRYAQAAVHLNCVEYLLKPVSIEELSAAVESAIDMYDNELCRAEYAALANYWLKNCNVVYEKFWKAVLFGTIRTEYEIWQKAPDYGVGLSRQQKLSLYLFRVLQRAGTNVSSPMPLLEDLQRVARDFFSQRSDKSYIVNLSGEVYAAVLLYSKEELAGDEEYVCGEFMEVSRQELSIPVVVIGGTCRSLDALFSLQKQLSVQLNTQCSMQVINNQTLSLVERIQMYVAENLSNDITKFSVAEYVAMNPDYVSKLFKKETGLSIPDYITQQKLLRARRMLLQTDHSIGVIATELGYTNFSYFTKLFCKQFGCTPKEYRKDFAQS